jgi:thiol-disulfide isomerase/thioredoxin
MNHRARLICSALAVAAVAAVVAPAQARGRYLNKEFPSFAAKDAMSGRRLELKDLRGKVVLIDFWATWCPPCRAELPNVKRTYEKYKDRGFEIVSISLDDNRSRFKSFVRKNGMDWYHVMEGGKWDTRLAKKYGIRGIPAMFVLDPNGVCIAENVRGRALDAAIERGLAKIPRGKSDSDRPSAKEPDRKRPSAKKREVPRPSAEEREARRAARAAIEKLSSELAQTRARLEETTGLLRQFGEQLEAIAEASDRLDAQLPVPDDPYRANRQFLALLEALSEARHRAFMLGLTDGEALISLPENPFEALPTGDPRSFVQAKAQVETARASIALMQKSFAAVHDELKAIHQQMDKLERDLHYASTASGLDASLDAVRREAADFEGRWRDPWRRQFETAGEILSELAEPLAALLVELDGLEGRIADVRALLAAAPRDVAGLTELRDSFGAVCADLQGIESRMQSQGVAVPWPAPPPTNPFDGRRLKDRRVLKEMAPKVDAAQEAVVFAREALQTHKQPFDRLAEQVAALEQAQRFDSGANLDELGERFSDLCNEILALHDRLAVR